MRVVKNRAVEVGLDLLVEAQGMLLALVSTVGGAYPAYCDDGPWPEEAVVNRLRALAGLPPVRIDKMGDAREGVGGKS